MEIREPMPYRNWNYESAAYERWLARQFLREQPRTQEEFIAFIALTMCHGENNEDYSYLERVWHEETIYPSEEYDFAPFSPEGQCGVTNFALGMLLAWSEVADMDKIHYQEGSLYAANGDLISDHHAWIYVEGDDGKSWRIDLASHQFADKNPDPDSHMRIVMQSDTNDFTGDYPGVNSRCIAPPLQHPNYRKPNTLPLVIPVPNALSLQYEINEINGKKCSTPITEFDTTKFNGRLERLLSRLGIEPNMYLGSVQPDEASVRLSKFWYPDSYDFRKESLSTPDDESEADRWKAAGIHHKDEYQLSISEGILVQLIKDIARNQANTSTLLNWAHDCLNRVLPSFEEKYPGERYVAKVASLHSDSFGQWINLSPLLERTEEVAKTIHDAGDLPGYFAARAAVQILKLRLARADASKPNADPSLNNKIRGYAMMAALNTVEVLTFENLGDPDNYKKGLAEREWQYKCLQERLLEQY